MLLGTIFVGREEATLCTVKCLKEDRKVVFQMRNKSIYSTAMSKAKLKYVAGKRLDLYTGAIHPWSERITY